MNLFRYMEKQTASDDLTHRIDAAVQAAREHGKWRREFMTLQEHLEVEYDSGRRKGR